VSIDKYVDCSDGKEPKWKLHIRNTSDDHTETIELRTHILSANFIKCFLFGWITSGKITVTTAEDLGLLGCEAVPQRDWSRGLEGTIFVQNVRMSYI
jgi:hypothetical protein